MTESETLLLPVNFSARGGPKKDEENDHQQQRQIKRDEAGEGEEQRPTGFISNLINNIVSPLSPKVGLANGEKIFETPSSVSDGGAFNTDNGLGGGKGEDEAKIIEEKEQSEAERAEGGGGSIIDNIVSHLPASLQGFSPFLRIHKFTFLVRQLILFSI